MFLVTRGAATLAITPVTNQGLASAVHLIHDKIDQFTIEFTDYRCSAPERRHFSIFGASIVGLFLVDERKLARPSSIRHTGTCIFTYSGFYTTLHIKVLRNTWVCTTSSHLLLL